MSSVFLHACVTCMFQIEYYLAHCWKCLWSRNTHVAVILYCFTYIKGTLKKDYIWLDWFVIYIEDYKFFPCFIKHICVKNCQGESLLPLLNLSHPHQKQRPWSHSLCCHFLCCVRCPTETATISAFHRVILNGVIKAATNFYAANGNQSRQELCHIAWTAPYSAITQTKMRAQSGQLIEIRACQHHCSVSWTVVISINNCGRVQYYQNL